MADGNHAVAALAKHPIRPNVAVATNRVTRQAAASIPDASGQHEAINKDDGAIASPENHAAVNNNDFIMAAEVPWTHSNSEYALSGAAKFYAASNHALVVHIAMAA